ncbi:MAG: hypothetical protein QOJ19_1622, partial [Acidimicrobiia bacterium]|nr:hypothetical protein [Acidimicrobiia bacterium]
SEAQASSRQQLAASEERASQILAAAESEARRKQDAADSHANLVITNADGQSEQTMAAAREQANRLLMDARHQAEQMVSEARASANREGADRREALAVEVRTLEARREALSHNVELFEVHVAAQRERIEAVVGDLRTLLDDPERLTLPATPEPVDEPEVIEAPPLPPPGDTAPTETEADMAEAHADRGTSASDREVWAMPAVAEEALGETAPSGFDAETAEELEQTLPSSDTGVDEPPPASLAYEPDDHARDDESQLLPPFVLASSDESSAAGTGTAVLEPPAALDDEGDRTQQLDMTAFQQDNGEHVTHGGPATGTVPPSGWPAGGPPPPPPPPLQTEREHSEPLAEPPAPPPPPAPSGAGGQDPAVAPWASTGPVPSPPPAPAPRSDSFLDELRRAVGDEPTDDASDDAAKRFFEDRDPTDPAARFLEDPDSANRSWFGRRR